MYEDRTLTCRECGEAFVFSAGEQAFFARKGLRNDPARCPTCRATARMIRSVSGIRQYHVAVCARCGGQAIVPFAPRTDRPLYCSTCFKDVRAAGNRGAAAPA
jgi:CxxC-x17-CxxC domain-containing protein